MSKAEAAYENRRILEALVGETEIFSESDTTEDLDDYDESLFEIRNMIQYSKDMGDTEEIAFWRKLEMDVKMQKRRVIEKNKMQRSVAYA